MFLLNFALFVSFDYNRDTKNTMKISYKMLILTIFVCLLYANIHFWQFFILGPILFILLLTLTVAGWRLILVKLFNFDEKAGTVILALFVNLIMIGWLSGAAIVFYRLTGEVIALIFLLTGLISILIEYKINKKFNADDFNDGVSVDIPKDTAVQIPQNYLYILAYLIFFTVGIILLLSGRSGEVLNTPWQVIAHNFIYIFFLATLTAGALIFSHFRTPILLFLLVLNSFLLHSYLPLTHTMLYGADGWRHLAAEKQILTEQRYMPKVFSEGEPTLIQSVNPGRLSYSQFWGTTVIISRLLQVDLLKINIWLLPILWPIIFTLLLFELGMSLGWSHKRSLFLVWLSAWPFALQVAGAFTLPVNYGFLIWLLLIILIIKRIKKNKSWQSVILIAAGILSVFGYLLFLVLFWLGWLVAECLRYSQKINSTAIKRLGVVVLGLLAAFTMPILELAGKFSFFNPAINWMVSLKQLAGNFTAYYLASGPRSHMINIGNVFFNQTPSYAFVENVFTEWRWWLFGFMILALLGMVIGVWRYARDNSLVSKWLVIMSFGTLVGYIISRYFLSGENILTRRLDAVLALFLLILLFGAIIKIIEGRHRAIFLIILLTTVISASYTLGPVTRTVSENEYRAMEYIWRQGGNQIRHCIVADTYPLLALEAISSKEIIGGGFPIDAYFSQPKLTEVYGQFLQNLGSRTRMEVKTVADDKCFVVMPADLFVQKYSLTPESMPFVQTFGDVSVLEYD